MKNLICIIVLALALAGCQSDPEPAGPCGPGAGAVAECCQQSQQLMADMPECCKAGLTGGEASPCCQETPPGECCQKTAEIKAKMPACCQEGMTAGKAPGTCCPADG